VQEAALSALASLAKENPVVASALCKSPNDKDRTLCFFLIFFPVNKKNQQHHPSPA
jgi:hypothetical protein